MAAGLAGEVRLFACGLPAGWLECDGGPLSVAQYPILFAAIRTSYGGDGVNTFNLPDLRGASIVGAGASYGLGIGGGEAGVTLTIAQIPAHGHQAVCGQLGKQPSPVNGVWAVPSSGEQQYSASAAAGVTMAPDALQTTGAPQPHPNMQPYLALTYAIATGV